MNQESFGLITKDGLKLSGKQWKPEGKPECVLIIFHSIGDHSGKFVRLAEFFTLEGLSVISMDMRGHGLSEGNRSSCKDCLALYNDISIYLHHIKQLYPDLPKFIYGHGFGSNLAMSYFSKHPAELDGLIMTSPLIGLSKNIFYHPVKKFLRYFPFLYRSKMINIIPQKYYTHDKLIVEEYKNDSLWNNKIPVNLYYEIIRSAKDIFSNKHKINLPILLMHGTRDVFSSYKRTESFGNHMGNVTIKIWECLSHDLHNETARQEIYKFVLQWINEKLKKGVHS